MIPFLKPKIWYAFQGLPFETIDNYERLPWSKCSVLTNNLMYMLQYPRFTECFEKTIDKIQSDENKGVTFNEYMDFVHTYMKNYKNHSDMNESTDRNSYPTHLDQELNNLTETRSRGNTLDSLTFDKVNTAPKNIPKSNLDPIKTFNEYSWTLFRTKNISHLSSQSTLHTGFFQLWLLFITYSIKETVTNNTRIPVVMDLLEAKYWLSRIQELLGARRVTHDAEVEEKITEINYLEFFEMMQDLFRSSYLNDAVIEMALIELAEEALEGVIMKGQAKVDRSIRYCVLKSYVLFIYNNKNNATNFRSYFAISGDTEILAGINRIQLRSPGASVNSITLEIADIQQLNKWRTAFTEATYYSKQKISNPAIYEAQCRETSRKMKRADLKAKRLSMESKLEEERNVRCRVTEAMEEQLQRADEELKEVRQKIQEEQIAKEELLKESENIRQETDEKIKNVIAEQELLYKAQLEKLDIIKFEKEFLNEQLQATIEEKCMEEQKRTYLEEKHFEAQQMLSEAEDKIKSLKQLGEQLEKALEEERQAKEEDEIVRNATNALLDEEMLAKAKLEELLEQQKNTINHEIFKNTQFSEALNNERIRIQEIAEEKERLSKQLEDSQQRMQTTGTRVKNLDSKVSKIAENVFGKEDTIIPVSHRGRGFIAEVMFQSRQNKIQNLTQIVQEIDESHVNLIYENIGNE